MKKTGKKLSKKRVILLSMIFAVFGVAMILILFESFFSFPEVEIDTNESKASMSKNASDEKQEIFYFSIASIQEKQNRDPVIEIKSVKKMENGITSASEETVADPYVLEILDNDEIIDSLKFCFPEKRDSPPMPGERVDKSAPLEKVAKIGMKWNKNATKARVVDKGGKVMADIMLGNIQSAGKDKKPDNSDIKGYLMIQGDSIIDGSEMIKKNSQVKGSSDGKYVDFAIVANGYDIASLPTYRQKAQEFVSYFLSYEPFKSSKDDFRFHVIENTGIILSVDDYKNTHNYSKVVATIGGSYCADCYYGNSPVTDMPYDGVIILDNSIVQCGTTTTDISGGGCSCIDANKMPFVPNNKYSAQAFLHEVSHILGAWDEYYIAGTTSSLTDSIYEYNLQCYAGDKIPVPDWEGMVSANDYYAGCLVGNWYRSARCSFMDTGLWSDQCQLFSPPALHLVNSGIDYLKNFDASESISSRENTSCQLNAISGVQKGIMTVSGSASSKYGLEALYEKVIGLPSRVKYVRGTSADFSFEMDTTKLPNGQHYVTIVPRTPFGDGHYCGSVFEVNNSNQGEDVESPAAPTGFAVN